MTQEETPPTDPLLEGLKEAYEDVCAEFPQEEAEDDHVYYARAMFEYAAKVEEANRGFKKRMDWLIGAHEGIIREIDRKRGGLIWNQEREVKTAVYLRTKDTRYRFVNTPWGRLQFHKYPAADHVVIDDNDVAVAAALVHCPSAVSTTHRILEKELKGFLLPGTHIEHKDEEDRFEYKSLTPKAKDAPKENEDEE